MTDDDGLCAIYQHGNSTDLSYPARVRYRAGGLADLTVQHPVDGDIDQEGVVVVDEQKDAGPNTCYLVDADRWLAARKVSVERFTAALEKDNDLRVLPAGTPPRRTIGGMTTTPSPTPKAPKPTASQFFHTLSQVGGLAIAFAGLVHPGFNVTAAGQALSGIGGALAVLIPSVTWSKYIAPIAADIEKSAAGLSGDAQHAVTAVNVPAVTVAAADIRAAIAGDPTITDAIAAKAAVTAGDLAWHRLQSRVFGAGTETAADADADKAPASTITGPATPDGAMEGTPPAV